MVKIHAKVRRIVFVNHAAGYLTIDIINAFADHFNEVGLIYGDIRVQDVALNPKVRKSKVIEKTRQSNIRRFIRWFIASIQVFRLLITRYRKYEVFYFSLPPFAYLSSLLLRRRFSILMWDVYPNALKIVGISEKNLIYRLWGKANKALFSRAHRIYTIGNSLAELLSNYVSLKKIIIIPLWSGIKEINPVNKENNPFIIEQGLQGKFIVEYSGNIGAGHNIESLIEAARLTQNEPDIMYLIIGRGLKVDKVRELINKFQLQNCMILPFQPDNMIRFSLAAADLSVVLIEDKIAQVSIPSKVYNIMAVGSPIISIAPQDSEINKLVQRFGNGQNFEKNDFPGLASFIVQMKNSPEKLISFREKSLTASKEFTAENANKYFETYFNLNE
jgi:hypothetical protein